MKKQLTPQQRLIVAADFRPSGSDGILWVKGQVLALADSLAGTGVILKVNSALRACGYSLIDEIHSRGLGVFADLKLFDVDKTVGTDGILLAAARPEIITIACATGMKSMRELKAQLAFAEVLGVTVLTTFLEEEARETFAKSSILENVGMFATNSTTAGLDGIICAPTEIKTGRSKIAGYMTVNTPNIRPEWSPGADGQNLERTMTPFEAMAEGADRIVVGSPILKAKSRHDAAMRTIDEIAAALAA